MPPSTGTFRHPNEGVQETIRASGGPPVPPYRGQSRPARDRRRGTLLRLQLGVIDPLGIKPSCAWLLHRGPFACKLLQRAPERRRRREASRAAAQGGLNYFYAKHRRPGSGLSSAGPISR